MGAKKERVQLRVRTLESKVTPFCCNDPTACEAAGGQMTSLNTYWYEYEGTGGGYSYTLGDCTVDAMGFGYGKLAAVADF